MGSYIRDCTSIMEHGLAGSTFGDLRGLSIVLSEYYGIYLGNYYLCEFTSGIFYCYLSFAGMYYSLDNLAPRFGCI